MPETCFGFQRLAVDTMETIQHVQMAKPLIQSDPKIMMGKPVVAGTRMTVERILEKLAAGETVEQLVNAHPRLTREAVLAALDYAARVVHPLADQTS